MQKSLKYCVKLKAVIKDKIAWPSVVSPGIEI